MAAVGTVLGALTGQPAGAPFTYGPYDYLRGGVGGGSFSTNQSASQQQASSFIPQYSETPILENIAKYSASMAPQVYQWGMDQYNRNQGNIDTLMRNALTYASPQRQAVDVGQAEAGVQQAGEAARQSALSDLQGYGIDPSAGRYAALDQASRVQTAASAAGAGNQQRMADIAQGNAMQQQAISSSLQNVNAGLGAANAANQFAGTAMNLKYAPLGQTSSGSSESSGFNFGGGSSGSSGSSGSGGTTGGISTDIRDRPGYGETTTPPMQEGGVVPNADATDGGYIPTGFSPSNGAQTDDVKANLNVGEFVIPRDVTQWLGQAHFYKLMDQARKARAMASSTNGKTGYGAN
jgi:hypothetical protein